MLFEKNLNIKFISKSLIILSLIALGCTNNNLYAPQDLTLKQLLSLPPIFANILHEEQSGLQILDTNIQEVDLDQKLQFYDNLMRVVQIRSALFGCYRQIHKIKIMNRQITGVNHLNYVQICNIANKKLGDVAQIVFEITQNCDLGFKLEMAWKEAGNLCEELTALHWNLSTQIYEAHLRRPIKIRKALEDTPGFFAKNDDPKTSSHLAWRESFYPKVLKRVSRRLTKLVEKTSIHSTTLGRAKKPN